MINQITMTLSGIASGMLYIFTGKEILITISVICFVGAAIVYEINKPKI